MDYKILYGWHQKIATKYIIGRVAGIWRTGMYYACLKETIDFSFNQPRYSWGLPSNNISSYIWNAHRDLLSLLLYWILIAIQCSTQRWVLGQHMNVRVVKRLQFAPTCTVCSTRQTDTNEYIIFFLWEYLVTAPIERPHKPMQDTFPSARKWLTTAFRSSFWKKTNHIRRWFNIKKKKMKTRWHIMKKWKTGIHD